MFLNQKFKLFNRKNIFLNFKLFLRRVRDFYEWDQYSNRSWSQEGEDLILNRIFEYKKKGFYIDVGSHHPKRFSNTYLLYRRGWNGINIDAMPGSMENFRRYRPRDINIEAGIAETEGFLRYYIFNEPALNGFSKDLSLLRDSQNNNYRILNTLLVPVSPLSKLLKKYLRTGHKIDFLSVDVEGFDLEVLKSNDWTSYRPHYVLVEILSSESKNLYKDTTFLFMQENEYIFYAKCMNTVFFVDQKKI